MALRATCPNCQAAYTLADAMDGKKVRCNACNTIFPVIPDVLAEPTEARLTQTPGLPARSMPAAAVPVVKVEQQPAAKVAPPVKRSFAFVFVLLALFLGGGVLLVGGGSAIALTFYLTRGPSPALVAQNSQDTTPFDEKPEDKPLVNKTPTDFNITEVRKSVVYIKRLSPIGVPIGSGTGFFISDDGLIYTNRHVIQGVTPQPDSRLLVGVPSRKNPDILEYFKAELVYTPPGIDTLDFAILKITARPDYGAFPKLTLATETPILGAPVAAVGYPGILDLDSPTLSFNKGFISATSVLFERKNFYQTDAAINPGNSGGPLINARGEVVAIVTLKKPGANNMGYALQLSEIKAVATPKPQQLARAKPEAGPVDLKALPQPMSIAPEAANWQVNMGQARERNRFMTLDNNGGIYWMTTREDLPENFHLTAEVAVEFLVGNQRLQPTQRNILRTLMVRFAAADPSKNILEKGPGYQIKFTHQYLQLCRNEQEVRTEQIGNPGEPFILTIIRRKGEILMMVDDRVVLQHNDPNPLPGRAKFSIGGYLSRLYMTEVKILAIDGDGPAALPLVKRDPKKDPIDLPKTKEPGQEEPMKPQTAEQIELPGLIGEVVVAAGGKLLIFSIPSKKKLAIVDVAEGKVVKELALPSNDVKVAAGLEKLILLIDGRRFERWNLQTFQRETEELSRFPDKLSVVCMGAASKGPLLIGGSTGLPQGYVGFLDLDTLKPLTLKGKVEFGHHEMRASGDGKMFTLWLRQGGEGAGFIRLVGDEVQFGNLNRGLPNYLLPGAEGQALYSHIHVNERSFTCRTGAIYSPEGKLLRGGLEGGGQHFYMPALQGRGYFDFPPGAGEMECFDEEGRFIGALKGVAYGIKEWEDVSIGFDRRVMWFPLAGRVVVIPSGNTRVLIYKLELEK